MNAKKDEESDSSLITFYEASGKTIYDALEKIMLDSPKELYLGHNEVVVISEELLKKENPLNYLDYFMRDPESEKDATVMVSKEKDASSILKIILDSGSAYDNNEIKYYILFSEDVWEEYIDDYELMEKYFISVDNHEVINKVYGAYIEGLCNSYKIEDSYFILDDELSLEDFSFLDIDYNQILLHFFLCMVPQILN